MKASYTLLSKVKTDSESYSWQNYRLRSTPTPSRTPQPWSAVCTHCPHGGAALDFDTFAHGPGTEKQ